MIDGSYTTSAEFSAMALIAKSQIDQPTANIRRIINSSNYVVINNELFLNKGLLSNGTQILKNYLVNNLTSIHLTTYFSNANDKNFNAQLTTSKELNALIVNKVMPLSEEIQLLSSQINQETDIYKHKQLETALTTRVLQHKELVFDIANQNITFFTCRHYALMMSLNLLDYEKQGLLNFLPNKTNVLQSYNLQELYNITENEEEYIRNGYSDIYLKNLTNNITVRYLENIKSYLLIKQIHALDNSIDYILNKVKNNPLNSKIIDMNLDIGKILCNALNNTKTVKEQEEIRNAIHYVIYYSNSVHPISNENFTSNIASYYLSSYSINTFIQFIREWCHQFYYNKPVNYEENFLLYSINHLMSLKIIKTNSGIQAVLYDVNNGFRTKIVNLTNAYYANKIDIFNFLTMKQLIDYNILLDDNYNLATISCCRVCLPQ